MSKWIVSLSGGLDSCVALAMTEYLHSKENIRAVTFNYGQRHKDREFLAANLIVQVLRVDLHEVYLPLSSRNSALTDYCMSVPDLTEMVGLPQPPTYVPYRNLVFASVLCNYAQAEKYDGVIFGFHRSDTYGYWDTSLDFLAVLNSISQLDRSGHPIQIEAPFVRMTKGDIVRDGVKYGAPMHLSYSCYRGGTLHCGKCATCVERKAAFRQAQVEDKTEYLA